MSGFNVKVFLNGFIGCNSQQLLLATFYFYLILFAQDSKSDLFSKFRDVKRGRLIFGIMVMSKKTGLLFTSLSRSM